MRVVRNVLRAIFRHDAMNDEMNEEIRAHIAQATERFMNRGMTRTAAALAARREFGNVGVIAEAGRDARGAPWIDTLRGDVRYAARSLRHSPAFTAIAVLSLGLGIGANTAIFSIINAIVLRTIPVERPEDIVVLSLERSTSFSNPLFEQLRDRSLGIGSIAAYGGTSFNLASGGEERPVPASYVSGSYFPTLGVRPVVGRLLMPEDDQRGCAPVAVVSYAFWKSELGNRADVVGTRITMDETPFTIIGVAPDGFTGIQVGEPSSIFAPLCRGSSLDARSYWWLTVIARLPRSRSLDEANARLTAVSQSVLAAAAPQRFGAERYKEFIGQRVTVASAATGISTARAHYASPLYALMAMVVVILLISCANVANLMLARGAARAREIAIRIAIGASRARLIRQLLMEAMLLGIAGAAIGIVLATWTSHSLLRLISADGATVLDVPLDVRVLAFTAAVALTTVLLCGLVPAWRATQIDPQTMMKEGGSGRGSSGRHRIGRSLVVAQCALALTVITAAGLLVGTLERLIGAPTGFDARSVTIASVNLRREKQGLAENVDVQRTLLEGIRAVPGIESASITNLTPVGGNSWNGFIAVEGIPASFNSRDRAVWFNSVGDDYFRTLRTRVIRGRDILPSDTKWSTRVALMNTAAVNRYFPGIDPIGKTFRIDEQGTPSDPVTVVGVVEDTKYKSLRTGFEPIIYLAAWQDTDGWATPTFLVRSGLPTSAVTEAIKAVTGRVDQRISLRFDTLADQIMRSVQRERVLAVLSAFFGAIAFILALIGLYGVMAYSVATRRVEIGVRVALGAARPRIIAMVVGDVGRLTGLGVAIGAAGAVIITPLLRQFLYGVQPNDLTTLLVSAAVLIAGALAAGAIPAWRAASVQAIDALRQG